MKKRKVVFGVIGGIVVLVLAAVLAAWVMIDRLAKRAVEDGGQYALGVPTKVDSVNLSLLGGTLKMNTLNVANPTGYGSPHLMQSGRFHLAVNPGSVFGDTVVIPTFELDGLDVNIESKTLTNNIAVVLDHVKKLGGDSAKPQQQPQPQQQESSSKKVRVDKVVIRNVVAHVILPVPGMKPLVVNVPTIELNNVSSDKGISIDQLISRLMPAILAAILESGKGIIPQDLLASLNTDLASTVNALGGQAAQLVQQGVGQAAAQVQQALQQVESAVPGQVGQAVGHVSQQAQGSLGLVPHATVGQFQNIAGSAAATQPAGQSQQKNGAGKTVEGLFKKK